MQKLELRRVYAARNVGQLVLQGTTDVSVEKKAYKQALIAAEKGQLQMKTCWKASSVKGYN
jgi:hypothetical protein